MVVHYVEETAAAVEAVRRFVKKARLPDAVRVREQKAQARTVVRSFSKWRLTVELDKSNAMSLEVVVVSPHLIIVSHLVEPLSSDLTSPPLISASLISPPHRLFFLNGPYRFLFCLTLSHLIPENVSVHLILRDKESHLIISIVSCLY
jgi:hypothetical protein